MSIYYFTIVVLTGLGYMLEQKKKGTNTTVCYLAVVFVWLTFVASFRYAIGFDYFSYQHIYETTSSQIFRDLINYYWYEPLYFTVNWIFGLSGCPFPIFLVCINSFLFVAAVWFIYQYSRIPWASVYLYITLQFLAYDMNLIRQSIAIAFFMFAYPFLINRKIVPFMMCLFLGGLFHNSLLFMWPLYFLLSKRHSKKFYGSLIVLAFICYCFFDPLFHILQPILPIKYASYPLSYFWNANSFVYVVPSAIYLCFLYLFRNRMEEPVRRSIFINSALFNFLINLFITKHFILERFSVYPFIFSLLAIPEIIDSYQSEEQNGQECHGKHRLAYYGVLLLFFAFGGVYFMFAAFKGFHNVYPYISLLDKSYS